MGHHGIQSIHTPFLEVVVELRTALFTNVCLDWTIRNKVNRLKNVRHVFRKKANRNAPRVKNTEDTVNGVRC